MSKRIIFTFDDRSLEQLEEFKRDGGFASFASAVRESLQLSRSIQQQALMGFDQVLVENSNGKQKMMVSNPMIKSKGIAS